MTAFPTTVFLTNRPLDPFNCRIPIALSCKGDGVRLSSLGGPASPLYPGQLIERSPLVTAASPSLAGPNRAIHTWHRHHGQGGAAPD